MRKRARLPSAQGNVIRAIFCPAYVYFIELFILKTDTHSHKYHKLHTTFISLFFFGLFFVYNTALLIYFKALTKVDKYITTLVLLLAEKHNRGI